MMQTEKDTRGDLQFSLLANELRSSSEVPEENTLVLKEKEARIVIYTDKGKLPTFIRVDFTTIDEFTNSITQAVDMSLGKLGKSYPLYIIKEVVDNFIFAQFSDITVSVMENGHTLRFSDHGAGIIEKDLCLLPGFSTASSFHRKYIRATGSGLTIVSDYMSSVGGELKVEDNFNQGTVITLCFPKERVRKDTSPLVGKIKGEYSNEQLSTLLNERQKEIMNIASHHEEFGPSLIKEVLNIPVSTAYRDLTLLETYDLIEEASRKKKQISARGLLFIKTEL